MLVLKRETFYFSEPSHKRETALLMSHLQSVPQDGFLEEADLTGSTNYHTVSFVHCSFFFSCSCYFFYFFPCSLHSPLPLIFSTTYRSSILLLLLRLWRPSKSSMMLAILWRSMKLPCKSQNSPWDPWASWLFEPPFIVDPWLCTVPRSWTPGQMSVPRPLYL